MSAPKARWGTPQHLAGCSRSSKAGWARIKSGDGFLYVAELIERPGEVKIGFSLNPKRRVADPAGIQSRCKLLASIPGTLEQEKALHRALDGLQVDDPADPSYWRREVYPISILSHPAIPAELRSVAA